MSSNALSAPALALGSMGVAMFGSVMAADTVSNFDLTGTRLAAPRGR